MRRLRIESGELGRNHNRGVVDLIPHTLHPAPLFQLLRSEVNGVQSSSAINANHLRDCILPSPWAGATLQKPIPARITSILIHAACGGRRDDSRGLAQKANQSR